MSLDHEVKKKKEHRVWNKSSVTNILFSILFVTHCILMVQT